MKQKYLYIAAAVIAVLAAIMLSKMLYSRASSQYKYASTTARTVPVSPEEPMAASIEKVKDRIGKETVKISGEKPASLAKMYSQYPKEDAGANMVASWAKVQPAEKAKVYEQLDQQIAQSQEALKTNPEDKKAKQILFISTTLKKMCKANFDYNLLESIPQDEGGFKKKSRYRK